MSRLCECVSFKSSRTNQNIEMHQSTFGLNLIFILFSLAELLLLDFFSFSFIAIAKIKALKRHY